LRATDVRFYVNFRPIVSRTILSALRNGYRDKLLPNHYPPCAIFINLPPREIDVNVHPAKTEIRFVDESSLFAKVKRLVEYTLRSAGVLTDLSLESESKFGINAMPNMIKSNLTGSAPRNHNFQESFYKGGFISTPYNGKMPHKIDSEWNQDKDDSGYEHKQNTFDPNQPKMWQFMDSFIIVPFKDSLLLIDQHNAHERILYEEAIGHLAGGKTAAQQLLFPITVDLTPGEFSRWKDNQEALSKLGYEIVEFGGNTLIISGIPAGIDNSMPELALRKILDDIQDDGESGENPYRSIAASFACHSAIKAGQKLSSEEMAQVCDRLFACEEFNLCPHGRPITARLTIDEIQKKFQRQVPSRH